MPFKSKAQRRKFAELLMTGKITDEAYERWNKETGGTDLPERVRPKTKRKAKSRKKPKRTSRPKTKARSKAKPKRKSRKR